MLKQGGVPKVVCTPPTLQGFKEAFRLYPPTYLMARSGTVGTARERGWRPASMSAAQAHALAHTALYMEVCCELTNQDQMRDWMLRCNSAGFAKRRTPLPIFERVKEALGLDQRCSCGGIWVCGLHLLRRCGEETHMLDWYV